MAKRNDRTREPDFWGMARSFLHDWCPRVRGLSPRTVESYTTSLENLLEFLSLKRGLRDEAVTFDALGRDTLKAWVRWMREERGYAPRTVALRLTAVRSLLKYSSGEDPTLFALWQGSKSVRAPSPQRRPIEYLEESELRAVLDAEDGSTALSRRNRAMLIALYESAARVSELCSMNLGDVELEGSARFTIAHGKGGKSRVVPMGDACAAHMRAYVEEFHQGSGPDAPLFFARHGGVRTHLSPDTVSRVLRAAGDIARKEVPTVMEGLRCHVIRKTRAMDLYRAGVPLPLIMQMLGHESMSTTSSFYAFATQDMMARAIAESAPKVVSESTGWLTEERRAALYSLR